jgi:hypothetical protein
VSQTTNAKGGFSNQIQEQLSKREIEKKYVINSL